MNERQAKKDKIIKKKIKTDRNKKRVKRKLVINRER